MLFEYKILKSIVVCKGNLLCRNEQNYLSESKKFNYLKNFYIVLSD